MSHSAETAVEHPGRLKGCFAEVMMQDCGSAQQLVLDFS